MTDASRLELEGRTGYCLAPVALGIVPFLRIAPESDWRTLDTLADMTDDRARDEIGRINVVAAPKRLYGDDAATVLSGFVHWDLSSGPYANGTIPVMRFDFDRDVAIAAWKTKIGAFLSSTEEHPMEGSIDLVLYSVSLTGTVADYRGVQPLDISRAVVDEFALETTLGILSSDVCRPGSECVLAFRAAIVEGCCIEGTLTCLWDGTGLDIR